MPGVFNVINHDAAAVFDLFLRFHVGQETKVVACENRFAFFWLIQSQTQFGPASAEAFEDQTN